jgi:hypothetical protein
VQGWRPTLKIAWVGSPRNSRNYTEKISVFANSRNLNTLHAKKSDNSLYTLSNSTVFFFLSLADRQVFVFCTVFKHIESQIYGSAIKPICIHKEDGFYAAFIRCYGVMELRAIYKVQFQFQKQALCIKNDAALRLRFNACASIQKT